MKKLYFAAMCLALIHMAGCGVPGNLKTDMQKLDMVFTGRQNNASLDIEFTVPPGPISGSTEMFVGGVFIQGAGSLDTTPLAYEMADTVFSKLFGKVGFIEPSSKQRDGNYLLKLQATPSTSTWNGAHTADVGAEFYNLDKSLFFETRVKHVVHYGAYAKEMPMRRAYLRAFNDIAWQIQRKLQGPTNPDDPNQAALMRSAKPVVE